MRERLTNLLRTLLDSSEIPLNELAVQFDVTIKTIRNEIQVLNDLLARKTAALIHNQRVSLTII
ncbi:PTS system transporter subunit IIA, partial [Lacticaseibacillus rhamnosus MTCC 5462]